MNESNENELNSAMETLPMGQEAPTKLKEDLLRLARSTPDRKIAKWPSIPALALTGVAAIVVVVALTITPTHAAAKTWTLIRQAVEKVTSVEFTVDSTEHGKNKKIEVAMSGGKIAVNAGDGQIVTLDGGHIKVYDPKENTIHDVTLPGGDMTKQISEGISQGLTKGLGELNIKTMFAQFESKYGKANINISPPETLDGVQVYRVQMSDPSDGSVVHMVVDARTDLPQHLEVADQSGRKSMQLDMKFNQAIDASLLNPEFPKDAKIDREDLSKLNFNFSGHGKGNFEIPPGLFDKVGGVR